MSSAYVVTCVTKEINPRTEKGSTMMSRSSPRLGENRSRIVLVESEKSSSIRRGKNCHWSDSLMGSEPDMYALPTNPCALSQHSAPATTASPTSFPSSQSPCNRLKDHTALTFFCLLRRQIVA
jgi:hypothetical protein